MKQVYFGDWLNKSWREHEGLQALKDDFSVTDENLKGVKILFASYEQEGYEGSAFVLFKKEGKLYEVNGGHCSCYGLEDQWKPEGTNLQPSAGCPMPLLW